MKKLMAAAVFAMIGMTACMTQGAPEPAAQSAQEERAVDLTPGSVDGLAQTGAVDGVDTSTPGTSEFICHGANCRSICVCEHNYCLVHAPDQAEKDECNADFAFCQSECTGTPP